VPDLHGWITQQIDETDAAARKAAALCGCHPPSPHWAFGDETTDGRILVDDDPHPGAKRKIGRRWNGSYEGMFMAEHVVRHDPAAVLRRCEADRKILDTHSPIGGGWPGHYVCSGCGYDGGYCPEPYTEHVNDCPTLLALAEGYGLTEEQRAQLDRPEAEQPPHKPGFGGIPDVLVEQMLRVSLSTVPVALRGPNWKARP
jgi:hypothetical protein